MSEYAGRSHGRVGRDIALLSLALDEIQQRTNAAEEERQNSTQERGCFSFAYILPHPDED